MLFCMTSTTPTQVLAEVRAEMARQGMSLTMLASAPDLGLTTSALSRRLSGKSPFQLSEVLIVCEALNVSLATLATRAETVAA